MPFEITASQNKSINTLKSRLSGFETEEGRLSGLNYVARENDCFISTTPKAGTTWMQQIVHQLRMSAAGRSSEGMDFNEISEVVPWLELAYDQHQDLDADQVAVPRCFKTHCWYDHCPRHEKAKYIVVVRNPMDVAVSFFKFFEGWFFKPGEIPIELFVREFWLARGKPESFMQNASYFDHFNSWWMRRNDNNVLILFFENMKEDLRSTVVDVANFLEIPCSKEVLDTVVGRSTFSFMKKHSDHFDEKMSKLHRNEACGLPKEAGLSNGKVRSGSSGSGKVSLSESLKSDIEKRWQEDVLPVTGFRSYEECRRGTKVRKSDICSSLNVYFFGLVLSAYFYS